VSTTTTTAAEDGVAFLLASIRTGDWLDAQTFPPLQWAVPGIIPEGFGLLVGPPKAGKSWAALSVALSVASGGVAFGKVAVGHARPVLYLALEDGDRRLQDRCRMLLGEGERIPAALSDVTQVENGASLLLIEAWLDQHRDERPLVLLDTLGKVAPPAAMGESAYSRDYRTGGALKRLADKISGATLLTLHHDRKAGAEDFVDSVSGTHGLAGAADFLIVLDRKRQEDNGILKVTGRDVVEAEYAVSLSDRGRWTLLGDSLQAAAAAAVTVRATAGLGDRSTEIVNYVVQAGKPVTPSAVAEALGIPEARRYLSRLADEGRLHKHARGLYTCVPTVPMSHSIEAGTVIPFPTWDKGTDGTGIDGGDDD
jgi:hypothetical protein